MCACAGAVWKGNMAECWCELEGEWSGVEFERGEGRKGKGGEDEAVNDRAGIDLNYDRDYSYVIPAERDGRERSPPFAILLASHPTIRTPQQETGNREPRSRSQQLLKVTTIRRRGQAARGIITRRLTSRLRIARGRTGLPYPTLAL